MTSAAYGDPAGSQRMNQLFRDCDIHAKGYSGLYRSLATNIYKTKDGRFFHLHGSMNPEPSLDSVGLPHTMETASFEEGIAPYVRALSQIDSDDMQRRAADEYRQAGTICYSTEEYASSEHGKANANVGLYEISPKPNPSQKPGWWESVPSTGAERPLAGLKVVDLTRIIAAPAITRGLAEMGASVMRITGPHLPDLSQVHPDLNWGKWNACLDLRQCSDRMALKELILDADVVVMGYRPGVMEKYGFGPEDIIDMCKYRQNGVIVARENCYGWHG